MFPTTRAHFTHNLPEYNAESPISPGWGRTIEKVALIAASFASGGFILFVSHPSLTLFSAVASSAVAGYLLHTIAPMSSELDYELIDAARRGDRIAVLTWLALGANPNANREDLPLRIAATRGDTQIVEDLLSYNADPDLEDSDHETPLTAAIEANRDEVVDLLLQYRADPQSALAFAIEQQNRFNNPQHDMHILGDRRTRSERQSSANRIVELLQRN